MRRTRPDSPLPETILIMPHTRREFLTAASLRAEVLDRARDAGDALRAGAERTEPVGQTTVRLTTRAMACDFAVLLNPGPVEQVATASEALDLVHVLEEQMSAYRADSELSRLNQIAAARPVRVERRLFQLLLEATRIAKATDCAFDPTAGPLIELWRWCRRHNRIPSQSQIDEARRKIGIERIQFDQSAETVQFLEPSVSLNLGGIGKGYALDRIGEALTSRGLSDWLVHGGHSSVLARGTHADLGGWPVGLRHPLFPNKRLGTLLLKNGALSTSGSGTQFFRHGGKRYGHIVDPRTGQPAQDMLSVTVVAPTAAQADAFSTAFFVAGLEKSIEFCQNQSEIGVILIPPPLRNRKLCPIICGIPDEVLFFADTEVSWENVDRRTNATAPRGSHAMDRHGSTATDRGAVGRNDGSRKR
ncbi:MAG TPA: FAD:protein FMN transferase [Planctomycetaceae bacterium]|nr:FAD:protein FMN transferase [Planctomycetaceae bacterium]